MSAEADPRWPVGGELDALSTQPLVAHGLLADASNHTFLVQVGADVDERFAVYKPRAGERPLWDFPRGTLCQREVAAYVVDAALGWELVPPTVLRDDAPHGPGAVQRFVPHDPDRHYFALLDEGGHERRLAQMALFDLVVNNADRKGGHVVMGDDGQIFGIDHGLTFHVQPKLRTVVWDVGGYEVDAQWREDVRGLAAALADEGWLRHRLADLLSEEEIAALAGRAAAVADLTALPELPPRRRPYPFPPL